MNNFSIFITTLLFAQAYGTEPYGVQEYSVTEAPVTPTPGNPTPGTQTTTEKAPNTGLFGLPVDANYALIAGIALIVIAVVGAMSVLLSRARRKNSQEK